MLNRIYDNNLRLVTLINLNSGNTDHGLEELVLCSHLRKLGWRSLSFIHSLVVKGSFIVTSCCNTSMNVCVTDAEINILFTKLLYT